ncbi:pectin lyase fold/virulence factor [Syncephalastrum racemosum]|uniref:Pectin lyase fold/virulence factor n=1 Tax=Syncephalastrum racemosum TaxID=13706 RepID=A0A1X2HHV2_SYNRA|nr:pectin lyase fold/virulence factor [Syncephalastrum racemosum]
MLAWQGAQAAPSPSHDHPSHNVRKQCVVPPVSGDASQHIISTFERCNSHADIIFKKSKTYNVDKPMNITGLNDVHISIQGEILFSDNMAYWQENVFLLDFQSAGTWWILSGKDITVDGGGSVNGNAQVWWNAQDPRPVTMTFDNVQGLQVSDITITQAPFWHFFVRDTTNAVFENINISSVSNSTKYFPHNSDGWDLYRSDQVIIRNSKIVNSDDCVSFKANSTNVLVENLDCSGSHGLSVGSLGQYARDGQIDVVTGIKVKNVTCSECQNGARIKAWAGGAGLVSNITFEQMTVTDAENPIVITTHYCDGNQMDYCNGDDSRSLTIKDITFKDISGSVDPDAGKPIISLNCSTNTPCSDITLTNIDVKAANNTPSNVCVNVDGSDKMPLCSA